MKVCLAVLKNLLQSKTLIIFLIIVTTIRVLISLEEIPYDESRLDSSSIIGTISSINIRESSISLEINDTIVFIDNKKFVLGNKVKCVGNAILPNENRNFYLFNYRKFLASKGILYQMNGTCELVTEEIGFLYQIKNNIIGLINNRKSNAYLKAFTLGDTSSINSDVMASYRYNGINHLFAISGMHVTLLVTIISMFTIRNRNMLILMPILLFYLFLTDFPPSMIRAVSFFFLTTINKQFDINIKSIIIFLYITIMFLLINPYFLYSLGFIYSFTISCFLILYKEIFINEKNYFKKIAFISLIAFLVSIPINIQNNFYINLLSPIYNLFFVPIVSLIMFPASLIVLLLPFLDNLYLEMWIIIENVSLFLSEFNTILVLSRMNTVMLIIYFLLIIFILNKIKIKKYIYILLILILLIPHHLYPYFRNKGIVLMLDVGQGDSIIVVYPNKELVLLIDTGGRFNSTLAENIIIPSLRSLGLTRIDYLVLTHGDFDHMGEANNILSNFKVHNVLMNSGNNSELEISLINYMDLKNVSYQHISKNTINHRGIELKFLNEVSIRSENDDSLILLLSLNNYQILFMGDAGFIEEHHIINNFDLSDVDVLKVGHHGSRNSTSSEFLSAINPTIALISSGRNNIYNHPHPDTITRLKNINTFITSSHGAVRLNIHNRISIKTVIRNSN